MRNLSDRTKRFICLGAMILAAVSLANHFLRLGWVGDGDLLILLVSLVFFTLAMRFRNCSLRLLRNLATYM